MNTFSLLFFSASIVYIYLGMFAFRLDPKSKPNRVFLLISTSLALWSFAYAFIYLAADKDFLWFWFIVPVLVLICTFGVYCALTKHDPMVLTSQVATDEILSRMTDLLILTTPEGKITKVNDHARILLEHDKQGLIKKPISMVILEEDIIQEAFSAIKEITCPFYNHDATFKTINGEYIPVNISFSAIRDSAEKIIGVVIIGQDLRQAHQLNEEIVIRNRTEDALMDAQAELETRVEARTAELAQATEAFKAEKERFKALSENSPFGLVLLDKKGVFEYINPNFREMFGYDLNELPDARAWSRMAYPDPKYRREVVSAWVGHFRTCKPGDTNSKTFTTTCKDGTEKIVNFVSVQLEPGEFLMTCADITELKRLEDELRTMSLTDELTRLYNRRGFFTLGSQQLKMAERMNKGMMLIYSDIDNLKWINDAVGHHEGDNALINFSNILKDTSRESDIVARIGGDEFVVLAMETAKYHGEGFVNRLQDRLNEYNKTADRGYTLSISVGIVHQKLDVPGNLDSLLKVADGLMYETKRKKQAGNGT